MRKMLTLLKAVTLMGLLIAISGCSFNSKPFFVKYHEDGSPILEKRFRKHLAWDCKSRWSRKAYSVNRGSGPHFLLSEDQKAIKEEHGAPDYTGKFNSRDGIKVTEWLYWEEGLLFQFAKKTLLFKGELTDKERVLVVFGYPDDAQAFLLTPEKKRENFYYDEMFGTIQRSFNFMNGKCIESNFLK